MARCVCGAPSETHSEAYPFSSHMRTVRSSGKPYVSNIVNASAPPNAPPASSFLHRFSSSATPFFSVRENVASSSLSTSFTAAGFLRSSGKPSAITSTTTSTSWWKKPSGALRISPP